jgi:hypothetical protein
MPGNWFLPLLQGIDHSCAHAAARFHEEESVPVPVRGRCAINWTGLPRGISELRVVLCAPERACRLLMRAELALHDNVPSLIISLMGAGEDSLKIW